MGIGKDKGTGCVICFHDDTHMIFYTWRQYMPWEAEERLASNANINMSYRLSDNFHGACICKTRSDCQPRGQVEC
jgi:hypothetical protein